MESSQFVDLVISMKSLKSYFILFNVLIVVTGNGKGKTTSALGQALRVVGEGGKAVMYQFIKGPWKSGEDESVKRLMPEFEIIKGGKGFVGILGDPYPRQVHIEAAEKTWREAQKAVESKKYQLVVLDELNVALKLKLLKLTPVYNFLKKNRARFNIMVTGRDAHPRLIKLADLVSEVKEIKHPFAKGVSARKGIEY
ncbi:MAG: cob(I)yrinic acid a,c-diamide adenosyltransferase [Patescibacteria group bacterium]